MAKIKGELRALVAIALATFAVTADAHSARAVMDVAGNTASFTALARITCFNDGAGNAAKLVARVRDNSPAINNLFINLQLLKGVQALSITDTTPGDAHYSDSIALAGGNGVYTLLLNKTGPGARDFDVEWHCMTATDDHTGTDIIVDQFK
jgi:hypothetical protein